MIKICEVCKKEFQTKEGKQRSCSKSCGDQLRREYSVKKKVLDVGYTPPVFVSPQDLPPVDILPAVYLKACYDHWVELAGDEEKGTRIA
jgi:hypothetical protein